LDIFALIFSAISVSRAPVETDKLVDKEPVPLPNLAKPSVSKNENSNTDNQGN